MGIGPGGMWVGGIPLLAWGLGYFWSATYHRSFMAIRSVKDLKVARRIGMSWMIIALDWRDGDRLFGVYRLCFGTFDSIG
ncbi:MAG: hypothetical protein Q9M92_07930 [Enterobacterales bacterium]|nr:hypothetical protein [Enterobacterales bacterium]